MTGVEIALAAVAVASAAAGAAGTAISVQSSQYNQEVAENNAKYAQQKAKADAAAHERRTARLQSAQRARIAASGLDPGSGSPLEIAAETARYAEADRRNILFGGQIAANQFDAQAFNAQQQGQAAIVSGVGQLASIGASTYGIYQNRQMLDAYMGRASAAPVSSYAAYDW